MTFQALRVRIAVILSMTLIAGLGHSLVLTMTLRTFTFTVPTILELCELCRVTVLADLIAEIVLEGGLDGIMAIETLRVHITSDCPVVMLDTVAGIALIGRRGMVLVTIGAVLPAVRAHIETSGLIGVTGRTLLVGYLMFPVGCMRVMTIKT